MITVERRPIESLKPHPDNPRLGDVDAIKESIRVNGWHGVVVVQSGTHYILAGNHRTQAAMELYRGDFNPWPDQSTQEYENERARWRAELARLPVHVLICDDDTARRILLADNRTADRATYDDAKLLRLQAQILDPETALQVLQTPGASPEEIAESLRVLAKEKARSARRLRGTGYNADDVEQLSLAMEPAEGRAWGSQGRGKAEIFENWEQSEVRQITVIVPVFLYDPIMQLITKIGDDNGLETNTDVLMFVFDGFLREAGQEYETIRGAFAQAREEFTRQLAAAEAARKEAPSVAG